MTSGPCNRLWPDEVNTFFGCFTVFMYSECCLTLQSAEAMFRWA